VRKHAYYFFMSKLLLLPEPLIKKLLDEFGEPTGNGWFITIGESIDDYYNEHKLTKFSHYTQTGDRGTSIDSLKRSLGYVSTTGELNIEMATGANHYLREVLAKKYANGLNWTQYLKSIGLQSQDLLPMNSNRSRAGKLKSTIKDKEILNTTNQQDETIFLANCSTIAGYWLSRFEYISKSRNHSEVGYQIDIERLDAIGINSFTGLNLAMTSPSGKKYQHELVVKLFGDFLVGHWKNTNTKNIGAFQLFINTNMCVMTGLHLGNANDNTIQSGIWIWVKIGDAISEETDQLIRTVQLKGPEELTNLMKNWQERGETIQLPEIMDQ
jgi:hypothetical protein